VNRTIIIGTRGSELALWQAHFVKAKLEDAGHHVQIEIIKTSGDQIQHLGFDKMEGKGFFTKELEEALLLKKVDLAVHSCKDLETNQPDGLTLAAYAEEADPRDVLIVKKESAQKVKGWPVKNGALVGTSSARRKVQLLAHRPDLRICDLRGNVPTRLQKLMDSDMDAIVLAAAGVTRLAIDLTAFETYFFPAHEFVPAAAQGVLALQTRDRDDALIDIIQQIWPQHEQQRVQSERRILNKFNGGCQVPLGVRIEADRLFVSYAHDRNTAPRRISLPIQEANEDNVVSFLKEYQGGHRVFVSRNQLGSLLAQQLDALGIAWEAKSLISIAPVAKPEVMPDAEWVFFTSSNAVTATKGWFGPKTKFAALGKGTAATGQALGIVFDYIGQSSDTLEVVLNFKQMMHPTSVILPQSQIAIGHVADVLRPEVDVFELQAYQTNLKPAELDEFDVYIFTSPSNVRSFFMLNTLPAKSVSVAIGTSTLSALQSMGIPNIHLAKATHEFALADAVAEVLMR